MFEIIWQLTQVGSLRLGPCGHDTIGAGSADAIQCRSICKHSLVVVLLVLHLLQSVARGLLLGSGCRAMTTEGHGKDEHDDENQLFHNMMICHTVISPANEWESFSLTIRLSLYLPCRYIILVTMASTVES